jgi:hypothetical protein
MESPLHQLEYHVPTNRLRIRLHPLFVKRAIVLLFLIALGVAIFVSVKRMRLLWLQEQCLLYQGDPMVAVFDSRSSAVATLGHSGIGWRKGVCTLWRPLGTQLSVPYICYSPPAFQRFFGGAGPVAFMHLRVSPGGNQRLVIITYSLDGGFDPTVAGLATLTSGSTEYYAPWAGLRPSMQFPPSLSVAVFAGQYDRNRPDHFTILYRIGDRDFHIDGWLCDNDTVRMVDSAVTPTSQSSPALSR